MDERFTLMLHVRAGKSKRREETKSGRGGQFRKQDRCCGRDRQRRCREAMLVQLIQRGEAEETAELRDAPDKQERGGSGRGRGEEVKELTEEERTGTRLMLRPCRMHKAGTRQETPKEVISETTKTHGHQ